jgi:hypothetical protein
MSGQTGYRQIRFSNIVDGAHFHTVDSLADFVEGRYSVALVDLAHNQVVSFPPGNVDHRTLGKEAGFAGPGPTEEYLRSFRSLQECPEYLIEDSLFDVEKD